MEDENVYPGWKFDEMKHAFDYDGRRPNTETECQLLDETRWVWLDELPDATSRAQSEEIGMGRIKCPWCNDAWDKMLTHNLRGETCGLVRSAERTCRCLVCV